VLEGASELRIMLCRPKDNGVEGAAGRSPSTSIVAACGIYMKVCLGGGGRVVVVWVGGGGCDWRAGR
jgi:hypothetical protein